MTSHDSAHDSVTRNAMTEPLSRGKTEMIALLYRCCREWDHEGGEPRSYTSFGMSIREGNIFSGDLPAKSKQGVCRALQHLPAWH